MSEFDKEAEREKLRQKFAKEEEDRKSTQRMSELLLQGATMTNSHCNTCGDPIFRYDGNEFCPSCQAAGQQAAAQRAQADSDSASQDQSTAAQEQQAADTRDSDASARASRQAVREQESSRATDADDADTDAEPTAADLGSARQPEPRVDAAQSSGTSRNGGTAVQDTPQPGASEAGLSGEFAEAEADIAQTIRYFSELAASTDDPARARDCLATVREAADALAVLRE
ncbi:Sjogren's syndrome/scleroderma autoantigen 1 family protein [Haloarchaeobius sp. TZWWS8]|uniref:Sjogren's syndrome/scleroderma autoantigen 1 family protein n=1 Tax=Haloarchaeobius sp. TZWWS8 TaxID=3446121 RepID=UPI003EC0B03D